MKSYEDILYHETALEFQRSTKEYGAYWRGKETLPYDVSEKFKKALQNYRDYLDSIGIYMPEPKYRNFHRE